MKLTLQDYTVGAKIRRKGVHSKKRTSNNKSSINYKKAYRGQGR